MMSESDKIIFSVVMLSYNFRNYVGHALECVLDQKHNYNYEILISDDCSTDGTQDVIRDFEKKYPDVIKPVYNEKNLGAMANFYATVSRASGKYLMLCSGDDYWLPGKVEKQISFMERNLDFGICYGRAEVINDGKNKKMMQTGANLIDFKNLYYEGNKIPALTICVRMSFFKRYLNDIKPFEKKWLMEDYPLVLYTAFESLIYFIDETFAVYRVVQNSLSHQVDIKKQLRFEKSVYDVKEFFSKKYNLQIEPWNERKILKKIKRFRTKSSKCILLRKFIKCFIPYGIIVALRKRNAF